MPRTTDVSLNEWAIHVNALFDRGRGSSHQLPGTDLYELLCLVQCDYDDVDRLYIDHETVGG